jgi:hypothetical protein
MTKSPTSKVAAKKARTTHRKHSRKVAAEKASITHCKKAPDVEAENVRDFDNRAVTEIRATELPDAMSSLSESNIVRQFGATQVQVSMRARAGKNAAQQIEDFHAQVPASMSALIERNIAHARARYQHLATAFQAAFESWEASLDAAGQGAVALNRKIIDIAGRNISTGFDLATRLVASNNLAEAFEVQTAFWRKQLSELRMQAEEVRVLLEKVTSNVVEPIKSQMTREIDEFLRRIRSTRV